MKPLAAVLGTLLALTACANGTSRATLATSSATATTAAPAATSAAPNVPAAPRSAPPRTLVPVGPGTARARASAAPRAKAPAKARPVMPRILGAVVTPAVVGSGSLVSATVTTTANVVSVTAFAAGTSMPVPRVGRGLFRGSTTLPPLPPFAHGSYAVTFVARDANGLSTQSAVGVTVR
ncbi:MAG TPA: hypothetical protein VGD01_07080 [Candidatus Elarobacter sp.]